MGDDNRRSRPTGAHHGCDLHQTHTHPDPLALSGSTERNSTMQSLSDWLITLFGTWTTVAQAAVIFLAIVVVVSCLVL